MGPVAACLLVVAVFAASVAYNAVYALSVREMAAGRAHRAAMADTALYLIGVASLGALLLVGWWVVLPELVGQYIGTYWGTRLGARPADIQR